MIKFYLKLVKWHATFNVQPEPFSWAKKIRPEPKLSANVRDQNASGPTRARRPSTVKSLPNGCANNLFQQF